MLAVDMPQLVGAHEMRVPRKDFKQAQPCVPAEWEGQLMPPVYPWDSHLLEPSARYLPSSLGPS